MKLVLCPRCKHWHAALEGRPDDCPWCEKTEAPPAGEGRAPRVLSWGAAACVVGVTLAVTCCMLATGESPLLPFKWSPPEPAKTSARMNALPDEGRQAREVAEDFLSAQQGGFGREEGFE